MNLPEPGVTVTALVRAAALPVLPGGLDVHAMLGNVVADLGPSPWAPNKPHIAWEPVSRDYRLTLLAEDEGIMWARGGGAEVNAALLAAYRLR